MDASILIKRFASVDVALRLLLAVGLLLLADVSALPLVPPASVPASAPKTDFSAERAMADLRVVAREPHPAGSPAQSRVRDYILAQAAAAGLSGEVQKNGTIENVIVRVPGAASTGAVLITGHYDSHPSTPGAGDNGVSVAAMLETMRSLQAEPPQRNDVVFLFTDGEERGWLGAGAYIREHPATEQAKLALVFDARPGDGPLTLRETSPGDAWLIQQVSAAKPPLWAGSWLNADERSDTDTDFSAFAPAGFMGVEIENEARGTLYHTAGDTVEAVSQRLLQAQGETMGRLARHFGSLDLLQASAGPDLAYFTVPGLGLLAHPSWVTPAAAVLAAVALVGLAVLEWRRRRLSLFRSLLGTGAFLAALILIAVLASVTWNLLLAAHPVTEEVALGYRDFEGSGAWIAGILAAALVLSVAALYGLSRRIDAISLAVSGLLVYAIVWTAAYLFLDSANPLTTPYLVWPFVGGVAGLAILAFVRQRGWKAGLLFLAAIPAFVLSVPVILPGALQPQEAAWVPVLMSGLVLAVLVAQLAFILGWRTSAAEWIASSNQ